MVTSRKPVPLSEIDSAEKYRRYLPHWRASNATYFVTWKLQGSQTPLVPVDRSIIANALEYFNGQRYELVAYTVMDDHVHVLLTTHFGYPLEKIVHSWKSYTAHIFRINRGHFGTIWQQEFFGRIVRNTGELSRQIGMHNTSHATSMICWRTQRTLSMAFLACISLELQRTRPWRWWSCVDSLLVNSYSSTRGSSRAGTVILKLQIPIGINYVLQHQ
jgi:REP element-mobilizing transposase RayT